MGKKIKRRQEKNTPFYRNAASPLSSRYRKKLTAKTSWYKKSKKQESLFEMDEEEIEEMRLGQEQRRAKKPPETERDEPENGKKEEKDSSKTEPSNKNKAKAVHREHTGQEDERGRGESLAKYWL